MSRHSRAPIWIHRSGRKEGNGLGTMPEQTRYGEFEWCLLQWGRCVRLEYIGIIVRVSGILDGQRYGEQRIWMDTDESEMDTERTQGRAEDPLARCHREATGRDNVCLAV